MLFREEGREISPGPDVLGRSKDNNFHNNNNNSNNIVHSSSASSSSFNASTSTTAATSLDQAANSPLDSFALMAPSSSSLNTSTEVEEVEEMEEEAGEDEVHLPESR